MTMATVRLHYSTQGVADETRRDVEVKFPGPFEFEGREWIPTSFDPDDGSTLCIEHERTFRVIFEGAVHAYKGPCPQEGDVVMLTDCSTRVRVSDVAPAHHDSRRGSFRAERVGD